jgi:hypothetical protein
MSAPSKKLSAREFAKLEGCDEKQVRRALEKGKLVKDVDGLLDAKQIGNGWRKPNRRSFGVAPQQRVDNADKSKPSRTKKRVQPSGEDHAPTAVDVAVPLEGETAEQAAERIATTRAPFNFMEALRVKENYLALLKKLEFQQKEGSLVALEVAERVLFEGARADRDAWLNWPARVGPLIAADLGLEADRVTEILTEHVHKHVSQRGEPEPDFARAG